MLVELRDSQIDEMHERLWAMGNEPKIGPFL